MDNNLITNPFAPIVEDVNNWAALSISPLNCGYIRTLTSFPVTNGYIKRKLLQIEIYRCLLSLFRHSRVFMKADLVLSSKGSFILYNKSSLKMMKNAFYFTLQALFILKIFKFVLSFLLM